MRKDDKKKFTIKKQPSFNDSDAVFEKYNDNNDDIDHNKNKLLLSNNIYLLKYILSDNIIQCNKKNCYNDNIFVVFFHRPNVTDNTSDEIFQMLYDRDKIRTIDSFDNEYKNHQLSHQASFNDLSDIINDNNKKSPNKFEKNYLSYKKYINGKIDNTEIIKDISAKIKYELQYERSPIIKYQNIPYRDNIFRFGMTPQCVYALLSCDKFYINMLPFVYIMTEQGSGAGLLSYDIQLACCNVLNDYIMECINYICTNSDKISTSEEVQVKIMELIYDIFEFRWYFDIIDSAIYDNNAPMLDNNNEPVTIVTVLNKLYRHIALNELIRLDDMVNTIEKFKINIEKFYERNIKTYHIIHKKLKDTGHIIDNTISGSLYYATDRHLKNYIEGKNIKNTGSFNVFKEFYYHGLQKNNTLIDELNKIIETFTTGITLRTTYSNKPHSLPPVTQKIDNNIFYVNDMGEFILQDTNSSTGIVETINPKNFYKSLMDFKYTNTQLKDNFEYNYIIKTFFTNNTVTELNFIKFLDVFYTTSTGNPDRDQNYVDKYNKYMGTSYSLNEFMEFFNNEADVIDLEEILKISFEDLNNDYTNFADKLEIDSTLILFKYSLQVFKKKAVSEDYIGNIEQLIVKLKKLFTSEKYFNKIWDKAIFFARTKYIHKYKTQKIYEKIEYLKEVHIAYKIFLKNIIVNLKTNLSGIEADYLIMLIENKI